MKYRGLVERAWRLGRYATLAAREAWSRPEGPSEVLPPDRETVRRAMEAIVSQEGADGLACLNAHKEGIMKLAPFVKFREEKFGAVLFETRSEKVFTLNPTGAAVVREIVSGTPSEMISDKLRDRFDDNGGRLTAEVESFLAQLKEKGLVTV